MEPAYVTEPATGTFAASFRVKFAAVTVDGSSGSLNVAVTADVGATPPAPFAGEVERTAGGVVSAAAPVVNDQVKPVCSALPARSVIPLPTLAVYVVPPRSAAEGRNVAVDPLTETVPGTEAPPFFNVKVAVVTEAERTGSLKVAVTGTFTVTFEEPSAGEVESTVGGVVSAAAAVVKVQLVPEASALPARSLMPVVTLAV
ncbi:MAG: hypothetical protein OHK0028_20140 [Deltaproteobacteria bacterium]